jgi:TolA-binding protein
LQDYALIEEGRILEKDGKKEAAAAKYKELAEKFPGSPFLEEAKAKLGEKKEG